MLDKCLLEYNWILITICAHRATKKRVHCTQGADIRSSQGDNPTHIDAKVIQRKYSVMTYKNNPDQTLCTTQNARYTRNTRNTRNKHNMHRDHVLEGEIS